MSQFFIATTSGNLPPTVPTSFVEDTGSATPAANVLNVLGGSGIRTSGSGNTVTIAIQNGSTANATTVGAVTADIITIPLAATNQTYTFDIRISGIETTTPAGVGYNIFGTVRTNGVAASVVGTPDKIVNEDVALIAADANLIVSGNSAIIRLTGVAGVTINWGAFAVYVTAT